MQIGTGTRIRDYVVISLIARGGMGEIWLAREEMLGREVVLKRLQADLTGQKEFLQRFLNEARIQGNLRHPNIVQLYNFFVEQGEYFMVLEHVAGITLSELSKRTGPIPEKRSLHIFEQLASALNFAHSQGVIHRDVKPSNVMVETQNNDLVKVLDFGIARILNTAHLTQYGNAPGTILYMSPEQLLGQSEVDHRTDIYSAGLLLYEMLNGGPPFDYDQGHEFDFKQRALYQDLPDPRDKYPYISPQTVAHVYRLTAKDPKNRPNILSLPPPADPAPQPDPDPYQPHPEPEPLPPQSTRAKTRRFPWVPAVFLPLITLLAGFLLLEAFAVTNLTQDWLRGLLFPNAEQGFDEADIPENMALVEGGKFQLGSGQDNLSYNPPVPVTVSTFLIGKYEVTQAEWQNVMGYNPSTFSGSDRPVETVSWYDAIEYCNELSRREDLEPCYRINKDRLDPNNLNPNDQVKWTVRVDWEASGYRLPTEAEWEFAARGGRLSEGTLYSGSNSLEEVGWWGGNSPKTKAVGTKTANELGLHDMTGNVWEWCWDWYREKGYRNLARKVPRGPESSDKRVFRGGSIINSDRAYCTVYKRNSDHPSESQKYCGFRVARSWR